jgi:hypothetical protein
MGVGAYGRKLGKEEKRVKEMWKITEDIEDESEMSREEKGEMIID